MKNYSLRKDGLDWWIIIPKQPRVGDGRDDSISWNQYPEIAKQILTVIRKNKLPYIKRTSYVVHYGTAYSGGNPYVRVILSPLVENKDKTELETIITSIFNGTPLILTKYLKKRTHFLSKPYAYQKKCAPQDSVSPLIHKAGVVLKELQKFTRGTNQ